MRRLLLYYLALTISIIEVIMFASLILIPPALLLREKTDWFEHPFKTADHVDRDIEWEKLKRDLEKAKKESGEEKE